MIATDEEALICDLAETYGIFDYKSLPLNKVAIFSVGLRENSRIKMKMNGAKLPLENMLLAATVDHLALLTWLQSENGMQGIGRPQSILNKLLETEEQKENDVMSFETPEEFEKARQEIVERG